MITNDINNLRQSIPLKLIYRFNKSKNQNPRKPGFLKQDRKTLTIRQMIDKLNYIKFKNFHSLKDTVKNIKKTNHKVGKKYL